MTRVILASLKSKLLTRSNSWKKTTISGVRWLLWTLEILRPCVQARSSLHVVAVMRIHNLKDVTSNRLLPARQFPPHPARFYRVSLVLHCKPTALCQLLPSRKQQRYSTKLLFRARLITSKVLRKTLSADTLFLPVQDYVNMKI